MRNIIFVIIIALGNTAISQNLTPDDELTYFLYSIDKQNSELEDTLAKSDKTSLVYPLFALYKFLFSKNDIPKMCRFHPTCGNYGAIALKKHGLIKGLLKTSDRLMRCNNLHYKDQYIYLTSKNKYIDYP